jgi:hypothetical protein
VCEEQNAIEFLGRVAVRYATLESYRDAGVVRRDGVAAVRFRTAFRRASGDLRFEFVSDGSRGLVWCHRGVVHARYEPDYDSGVADDFTSAIGTAGGRSMGVASTIPALLLPNEVEEFWMLSALRAPRLIAPPRDAAGYTWYWIAGSGWNGQAMRVAIDTATLLVRRVEDDGNGRVRPAVTEYDAEANAAIAPAELAGEPAAGL